MCGQQQIANFPDRTLTTAFTGVPVGDSIKIRVGIGDRNCEASLLHASEIRNVITYVCGLCYIDAKAVKQPFKFRQFVFDSQVYVRDAQLSCTFFDSN